MQINSLKIGERLKGLRNSLTQEDASRLSGVARDLISKYEAGKTKPSFEYLLWASRHGGVTIDWIITGEQPREFAEAFAKAQSRHGGTLSDEQKELLAFYDSASKEIQAAAKAVLSSSVGSALKKRKASA